MRTRIARLSLAVFGLVSLPACGTAEPAAEPYKSSCPEVEDPQVVESYQAWTEALAENDHYRFVRGTRFVDVADSDPMNPSYCAYATTMEVIGLTVVGRELMLTETFGPLADTCEPGWTETADEVGETVDERAYEPAIVDDIYEICCAEVFLAPDGGGYDFFYTQAGMLMATCGDDYCDDGGCSSGTDPEVTLGPIEFL